MKLSFVAGFSPIVASPKASQRLYGDALGIAFDDPASDYLMTGSLPGLRHFGLWSLQDCAQACFGSDTWPKDRPIPQGSIEFDVESADAVTAASNELTASGYELLVSPKTEPWGQTVSRLQTPEGLLISVTYTPWLHEGSEPTA